MASRCNPTRHPGKERIVCSSKNPVGKRQHQLLLAFVSSLTPIFWQARSLHRSLGWSLPAGILLWASWLKLQEPTFFRSQQVFFFWPSMQATLFAALGLLPLLWWVQGRRQAETSRRLLGSPWRYVTHTWLGITLYCLLLGSSAWLACFTLYRIFGQDWPMQVALVAWLGPTLLGMLLAALAPIMAQLRCTLPVALSLWLGILVAALLCLDFAPLQSPAQAADFFKGGFASRAFSVIFSSLAATGAALMLSLATHIRSTRAI